MSNSSDDMLLNLFWSEVGEYLQILNSALLQIEVAEGDMTPLLREMNRCAHSMKGAARAVGVVMVEEIAHLMEDAFHDALHNGLVLTPDMCDSLYDGLDLIQNLLDGQENDSETYHTVLTNLEAIVDIERRAPKLQPLPMSRQTVTVAPIATPAALPPPPLKSAGIEEAPPAVPVPSAPAHLGEESVRVTVNKLDRLMGEASELLVARLHGEERARDLARARKLHRRWQREWRGVRAAYVRLARRVSSHDTEAAAELTTLFKFLETNQRYMQEANRQLTQLAQGLASDNLRLNTLADGMQDTISGMRLVAFDTILGSFQRMVRDIAREMGKEVQFDVIGANVELDKTVLDALKDPIMHLLRNAVDHGLESTEERKAAGKSPAGRIRLVVEQHGSEITVYVSDDGRGIDPDAVRRSAVRRGLIEAEAASTLSDDDARALIFHPDLSTADQVTAISGRGVGMDVVRDRVENLRGRVTLHSAVGQGTTTALSVPVSLTRLRCVLLRVGEEDYAVPSAMVMRMEALSRSDVFLTEGREMTLVNEKPAPLMSMAAVLDAGSAPHADTNGLTMLVLGASDRAVAFTIDELYSEQELVLKPLGPEIAGAQYVAGAALLGSGDVILVLDANQLVRSATGTRLVRRRAIEAPKPKLPERKLRVLVVDDSITTRTLEKNILETAGFDVRVAIDGVEAWTVLAESSDAFDVVISDVEMPHMNGLELSRRIKGEPRTAHLPVILLTSLNKPEQRDAGLLAGADAYLVKSTFDQDELLRTIQSVL
jgi:two-component system, chemotaxis family, sensor kinase CheA